MQLTSVGETRRHGQLTRVGAKGTVIAVDPWFGVLLLSALALRLALVALTPASFDVESYEIVARLQVDGEPVYLETDRYNYPPVWMWILAGVWHASEALGLSFQVTVRGAIALVDLLLATWLYLLLRPHFDARGWPQALLPALTLFNPVLLMISSVQGQFDAIPTLLSLAAYAVLTSTAAARICPSRAAISGLLLGAGIVLKLYPLVLLPVLLRHLPSQVSRAAFIIVAAAPTVIAFVPVWPDQSAGIVEHVLQYTGRFPYWGAGILLYGADKVGSHAPLQAIASVLPSLSDVVMQYGKYLTALVVLAASFAQRRALPLAGQLVLVFLAFFAVTVNFGVQYLVWPVPFVLLWGALARGNALATAAVWMATVSAYAVAAELYIYIDDHVGPSFWLQGAFGLLLVSGLLAWTACCYLLYRLLQPAAVRFGQEVGPAEGATAVAA